MDNDSEYDSSSEEVTTEENNINIRDNMYFSEINYDKINCGSCKNIQKNISEKRENKINLIFCLFTLFIIFTLFILFKKHN